MNQEFVKKVYESWAMHNEDQIPEVEKSIKELDCYIKSLKGHFMSEQAIFKLDDATSDLQADMHRVGFYTGFEVACNILHEMIGGE